LGEYASHRNARTTFRRISVTTRPQQKGSTVDDTPTDADSNAALVQRLYDALAALDLAALDELLDPDFHGVLSAGMPFGVGGEHHGAHAMRRDGWGAIGRYYVARAEPDRFLPLSGGGVLVTGRYVGQGRHGGGPLDAAFAHIITVSNGRIAGLEQYTDTARWREAAPMAQT
jgi:2-(1,2-epoxy-1,2-dihydrophenyl)acetyl-CoA isomerase